MVSGHEEMDYDLEERSFDMSLMCILLPSEMMSADLWRASYELVTGVEEFNTESMDSFG